jgi:hypothetical protein
MRKGALAIQVAQRGTAANQDALAAQEAAGKHLGLARTRL